ADRLAGLGRRTSRLRVSHAFHSPLMEPMLAEYRTVAASLAYAAPAVPMVSTVTGEPATADQLCDPDYWVRQVRQPVRFAAAVRTLEARGVTTFLELGPDGVLSVTGPRCVGEDADTAFLPLLRRDRAEEQELLSAVGACHVRGVAVDWA